ncbi:MAG: hypothetical protein ACYTEZ_11520 [Planctomycetota bacterium]|jgi:hypothetical protein
MEDASAEQKFAVLCAIVRAQHFAWRDAVAVLCPKVDPAAVVDKMWEITGRETARAYLKRIDPARPLAPQVAASIVWSSRCMGEEAFVEDGEDEEEAFVRHDACPWFHWHERRDLLGEDRAGCDRWFRATVDELNRALGTNLRVATQCTLPDGDRSCRRRLWVEDDG